MTVSAITRTVDEGFSHDLDAFLVGSTLYLAWTSNGGIGVLRVLSWRPHAAGLSAQVDAQQAHPFVRPTVLPVPSQNALLVVCQTDDSTAPELVVLRFNLVTGALLSGPTWLAEGARPRAVARPGAADTEVLLTYANLTKGAVYVRRSIDGGQTWLTEQPVLNQKVRETVEVTAVAFSSGHISVAQLGADGRAIVELGALTRTRPLTSILKHPTLDDRVLVAEAANRAAEVDDNVRGRMALTALDEVAVPTRTRFGVDDGIGDLALLDVSENAPVVVVSRTLPVGGNGFSRVALDEALTIRTTVEGLFGPGAGGDAAVVDLAVCPDGRLLVAGYTDSDQNGGLALVQTDNTFTVVDAGALMRAVDIDAGCNIVASVRTLVGGGERLVLGASPATPVQYTHKLPARVNEVLVQMIDTTRGNVFVATQDRLLVYKIQGLAQPIALRMTVLAHTRGQFMRVLLTPSGNLLCALGEGGVAVYAPTGECLGQLVPSGIHVTPWTPKTVYTLGALVAPTADSIYARQRRFFRCTQAGTSAGNEPLWGPTGTMVDGGARWVEGGSTAPVVTDVCFDNNRKRIYAVGVLGGTAGTQGRVWTLDGRWLL